MRGPVIFLMVMIFSLNGSAQTSRDQLTDSLEHARKVNNKRAIGRFLADLGVWFIENNQLDSAEYYLRQSLRWNRVHDHKRLIGLNLNDLGVVAQLRNYLDSAIYYYEKAIPQLETAGDLSMANTTRRNLGAVYQTVGLYPEALEVNLRAALYLEGRPPTLELARCYNTIGLVHTSLYDYPQALFFHRKAIRLFGQLDDAAGLAMSFNNIANCFQDDGLYDSAMHYYQRSLDLKRSRGDVGSTAGTLQNLGDLLLKTNHLREAEPYFREALALKKKGSQPSSKVSTFSSLARVNLIKGQLRNAELYLDSAEQIASTVGMLEELKVIYQLRIQLKKEEGDFQDAFQYSVALTGIKDSLVTAAKMDELRTITTRYEVGRIQQVLDQEKQMRLAEVEEKRVWITALVFIILLLTIIGLLIFHQFRTARKNKQHVELLLKELHHRVKNNLQILSSVLTFQSQELTDKGAIEAVKNSESRINAMALIHRKLYRTDNNRTIAMKEYFHELIEFLLYSNGYTHEKLSLTLDIDDFELDVDRAIPLGLIINELVNNAFKHAIAKHATPSLLVRSKLNGDDVTITISDNGLHPPIASDELTSFGLKMVNALLQDLRGSMENDYREGMIFQLNIPTA